MLQSLRCSHIPFLEIVPANKTSVEVCSEALMRSNWAPTPKRTFCREKFCMKAMAGVEGSLLHEPTCWQHRSWRSPRTPQSVKCWYFRCVGLEGQGTGEFAFHISLQSRRESVVLEKQIPQALCG